MKQHIRVVLIIFLKNWPSVLVILHYLTSNFIMLYNVQLNFNYFHQTTSNFPGNNAVLDEIEKYNGLCDAQCSR